MFNKFMLIKICIFALMQIALFSCENSQPGKQINKNNEIMKDTSIKIDEQRALEIARNDASKIYRDLSIYTVKAKLEADSWYVDYKITNPQMLGGGPHYIISAKTGDILSYRYEQ
jgi:hypothetical protein